MAILAAYPFLTRSWNHQSISFKERPDDTCAWHDCLPAFKAHGHIVNWIYRFRSWLLNICVHIMYIYIYPLLLDISAGNCWLSAPVITSIIAELAVCLSKRRTFTAQLGYRIHRQPHLTNQSGGFSFDAPRALWQMASNPSTERRRTMHHNRGILNPSNQHLPSATENGQRLQDTKRVQGLGQECWKLNKLNKLNELNKFCDENNIGLEPNPHRTGLQWLGCPAFRPQVLHLYERLPRNQHLWWMTEKKTNKANKLVRFTWEDY